MVQGQGKYLYMQALSKTKSETVLIPLDFEKPLLALSKQIAELEQKASQSKGKGINKKIVDDLKIQYDKVRTQILKNEMTLTNRSYVTYTFNGTDAVKTGLGEWTVNWIAPSTQVGPVTFYAGAVSANDDMTDQGDDVYTSNVTLINN